MNMINTDERYPILISEFNSLGIQSEAAQYGITHMREIGGGYDSNHEGQADWYVDFYALPDPNYPGCEIRVANTNGDPVWEDGDPATFAELAESVGVTF